MLQRRESESFIEKDQSTMSMSGRCRKMDNHSSHGTIRLRGGYEDAGVRLHVTLAVVTQDKSTTFY